MQTSEKTATGLPKSVLDNGDSGQQRAPSSLSAALSAASIVDLMSASPTPVRYVAPSAQAQAAAKLIAEAMSGESPHGMPDLSSLHQTNVAAHILNLMVGKSGYPEPVGFLVVTYARMVDKVLAEWSYARDALSGFMRGETPISQKFFAAQGMFEDLVVSLHRAMRFGTRLAEEPATSGLAREFPASADVDRVRHFRNRIAHGDDDLVEGKGGKGLATATPEITHDAIGMSGIWLSFNELAGWITQLDDFARVLIAHRVI